MPLRIILFSMMLLSECAIAQGFKIMRYDEDYSTWKDSTINIYNRIKYMPVSKNGSMYFSFGGEIREEFAYASNEDWGETDYGKDFFLLQRFDIHFDLKLPKRVRVFGQLRSGLENGRKYGPRRIDEDKLNIQNLFIDAIAYQNLGRTLTLRVGRQEIRYGSGRLIDVRDGPNLRLSFDGAKIFYSSSQLHIDGFVMSDIIVNTGIMDNKATKKPNLWGLYSTYKALNHFNMDLYYLGINRANAKFNDGIAKEIRHTFGARVWRDHAGFVYNFEVGYQLGDFGLNQIAASAVSSEIGYKWENTNGSPTVKLRSDYITGDERIGDRKLGTFNAIYPNGGYFGMNPQVGPANLISLHPNLGLNPIKNVNLTVDVVFNWRQSKEDGIYNPNGSFRLPSKDSKERYIGTAFMTTFSWRINDFLSYSSGVQYFKTGGFINDAIAKHKDGFFISSSLGIKF